MLIKRNEFMTLRTQPVKKMAGSILALFAICSTTLAPAAYAGDAHLTEQVVKVKLQMSDFKNVEGTKKSYLKLKKRAKSFCRSDSITLQYTGQTLQECADDLISQFIQSANIETLTEYHSNHQNLTAESTKLALNKS